MMTSFSACSQLMFAHSAHMSLLHQRVHRIRQPSFASVSAGLLSSWGRLWPAQSDSSFAQNVRISLGTCMMTRHTHIPTHHVYLHKVSADQSRLTTFEPKIHASHRTNAQVLKMNISPNISTCTAPIPACDTDPDCSQHA